MTGRSPEPDGQLFLTEATPASGSFYVTLANFEGPFDLLLQLIARHKMDVTEVALSKVTDEFISQVKAGGSVWDLETTSSFLVVAATLLDLKAARLLPSGEVDDEEDFALLEARDLLFARLLQYRAFKLVAAWLSERLDQESKVFIRLAGVEEQFANLLPEVSIPGGVQRLAKVAARIFVPPTSEEVSLVHLHTPIVSVKEQANLIVDRLRRHKAMTFRALTSDADRITVVARFLALLELFREAAVVFEQLTPLGELTIRWTGEEHAELNISDEFDLTDELRSES